MAKSTKRQRNAGGKSLPESAKERPVNLKGSQGRSVSSDQLNDSQATGQGKRWLYRTAVVLGLALLAAGVMYWYWVLPGKYKAEAKAAIASRRIEDANIAIGRLQMLEGESADTLMLQARLTRLRGNSMLAFQQVQQAAMRGAPKTDVQLEQWMMRMQTEAKLPPGFPLSRMLDMKPEESSEILFAWVSGCANTQQLSIGEQVVKQWLKDAPDDGRAWYSKGRIEELIGRRSEAAEAFGKAVKWQPVWLEARLAYADQLRHLQDLPAAIENYRFILERDSSSVQAWDGLTSSLIESGDHEAAEKALKERLVIQPSSYVALTQLAELALERDEFERAIGYLKPLWSDFEKDKELSLLCFRAFAGKGDDAEAMVWQQRYQEGEEAYKDYVQTLKDSNDKPLDAPTALMLAEKIYPYQFRESIPWLQSTISLDTQNQRAYELLAGAFRKQGRPEEAATYAMIAESLKQMNAQ